MPSLVVVSLVVASIVLGAPAGAVVLYDNGPFITHPGGGFGGADASRVQSNTLGMVFAGHPPVGWWLADQFTVPAGGWNVGTASFVCYQTGSSTTSTLVGVRAQIWNDDPRLPGATVVWGDTVTNRFASTSFTGVYRDSEISPASSLRPLMTVTATVGAVLAAGTYWLQYQVEGGNPGGAFCVPVTVLGQVATGDAIQFFGGSWGFVTDGPAAGQGMVFWLEGAATPVELLDFGVE
jgi:hypothetical protein